MHLRFNRVVGILLSLMVVVGIFFGIAMISAGQPFWHPRAFRPQGLVGMETAQSRQSQTLIDELIVGAAPPSVTETEPPVIPNAPAPANTRLYNNLLDNLLSSLHFYYRVPVDEAPEKFVLTWDPRTGDRLIGDAWLISLENNLGYLITLEIYSRTRTKAVFDEDLDFARKRVDALLNGPFHTNANWPLGSYFDLVELNRITGDPKYLKWADQLGAGDGPNDANTPLRTAKTLGFKFQYNLARQASPIYFMHAALLADWGKRHDPTLVNQSRLMFTGLRDLLLDPRYNMLWQQATVPTDGSSQKTLTETFSSVEQLTAIRAIIDYGRAANDPEAYSLAKVVLKGIWSPDSPMQIKPPEGLGAKTFYGLYTGLDVGREAERMKPEEATLVQVLLFQSVVALNASTNGEYRGDVDFLASWLETSGPVYRESANGYYSSYVNYWKDPENPKVSANAAIWMARGLAEDEWYKIETAKSAVGNAEKPTN